MLIIRRSNCFNTASGIVTLCRWRSGVPDGHLQRVTIPDAVLIQLDLLIIRTTVLETCRGIYWTYYKPRICALSWSIAKLILRCTVSKSSKTGVNNLKVFFDDTALGKKLNRNYILQYKWIINLVLHLIKSKGMRQCWELEIGLKSKR
jgi:hypothetical protein